MYVCFIGFSQHKPLQRCTLCISIAQKQLHSINNNIKYLKHLLCDLYPSKLLAYTRFKRNIRDSKLENTTIKCYKLFKTAVNHMAVNHINKGTNHLS